jgi:stage IV sporulation protein FB
MGWEDRPYYRERRPSAGDGFMGFLTGSTPLFTVFDIHVRIQNLFLIFIGLVLVFGLGPGYTWQDRVQSMTILFNIVLLHEFGHCFAARWVGGHANEIIMHPLGGVALASPPRRPLPTFITVAAGPAVNLAICIICGAVLYVLMGALPWNPLAFKPIGEWHGWLDISRYAIWIYRVSLMLLLFNLLPIFPLDGGQMLQSILWPKFGYYKSMNFSCITGMVGSVLLAAVGLASGDFWIAILAVFLFLGCLNMRRQLQAAGPFAFTEDEVDYSSSLYDTEEKTRRKPSRWAVRRAKKRLQQEQSEQEKVDAILEKVHQHGMHSLTWWEKRALHKATERQRQRDSELAALRKRNL